MPLRSRGALASHHRKGYAGICLKGSNGINVAYSSKESSILNLSLTEFLADENGTFLYTELSTIIEKKMLGGKKLLILSYYLIRHCLYHTNIL
jgi:hypothetical protein